MEVANPVGVFKVFKSATVAAAGSLFTLMFPCASCACTVTKYVAPVVS